jgi:hypothetical protein
MKGRPIRHDPKAAIGVETLLRALVVQVLCPTHDAAAIMSAFSINSDKVLRRTAGGAQMSGGATARAVVAPGVTAYTWLGSRSALASR